MTNTPHGANYFNVRLNLPSNTMNLISLWSVPSQTMSYNYMPYTDVDVLLMLSYGQLTQLAMAGKEICIHAIICTEEKKLCHIKLCIKASDFLERIPENFRQLPDSTTADNDTTRSFQSSSFIPQTDKPYLAPNPARDEVTVMGIAPEEVAEITILTMQGGQVAEFRNDYRFNVSRLAKASYIVRVVTTDKQVYYLKLVKQ